MKKDWKIVLEVVRNKLEQGAETYKIRETSFERLSHTYEDHLSA